MSDVTKQETVEAGKDHARIWLEPWPGDGANGRTWCQDKVWPAEEGDPEPTEYIRADLALTAAPAPAVGEPVAWQWRSRLKGGAWDAWERGRFNQEVPPFAEVEERPLYAHPSEALAAATEAIKELQAHLADRRFVRCGDECLADDLDPNCALEAEFQAQITAATERAEKAERERDANFDDAKAYAEAAKQQRLWKEAAEADLEKMRRALAPFSLEADNWHDDVPDDYCPLMAEPGAEQTNPGSEAVFSIGDLRRAREALSTSPRLSDAEGKPNAKRAEPREEPGPK